MKKITIPAILALLACVLVYAKSNQTLTPVPSHVVQPHTTSCKEQTTAATCNIISKEEPNQSGSMAMQWVLQATDTLWIDSLFIEAPSLFTFTIQGISSHIFSGNAYSSTYLLPGQQATCTATVTYNASALPFYPKQIEVHSFIHGNNTTWATKKAMAMVYFTPYSTTEIWNKPDFDKLPRVWMQEQYPEPARVAMLPSAIPTSTKPPEEQITQEWQHKYQLKFVQGLPYAIQMAALHPDSIAAKRYRDSVNAFMPDTVLAKTNVIENRFRGRITGKLQGSYINDNGNPVTLNLSGIRVEVYDDDDYVNDEFATGYTDANGNYELWYDRYQPWVGEGSSVELFVRIVTDNQDTRIMVVNPDLVPLVNNDPYTYTSRIKNAGSGYKEVDFGIWQLANGFEDPFKLLHWANSAAYFLNTEVGSFQREDLKIFPYNTSSEFSTIILHHINLENEDAEHETVIWHEFGHYVMQNLGATPVYAFGDHTSSKESNYMLAWSEGWATGFMAMVDQYYRDMDGEYGWYAFNENPSEAKRYPLERRDRYRLNGGINSNGMRSEYHIACALYDLYDGAGKFTPTEPQASYKDFPNGFGLGNTGYNTGFDDDIELTAYQVFKPLLDVKNGIGSITSCTDYYTFLVHSLGCDYPKKVQKVFTQNGILDNTDNQQSLVDILSSDDIGVRKGFYDVLYNVYTVEANSISGSSPLTTFCLNATQANETNFISDPLTINNGGKLGINASIIGCNTPLSGSTLSVNLCNQTVTVGTNGLLEIGSASTFGQLIIKSNGVLRIQNGGVLTINWGSKLVIESGAKLVFEQGAQINLSGSEAIIELKDNGKIEVGPNATFKFDGNGYIRSNVTVSVNNFSNIVATAPNSNAKVELRGHQTGYTHKVIEVTNGSISFDKSLSDVKIITATVSMGPYTLLDSDAPILLSGSRVTSSTPTGTYSGIWVYGQQSTTYINNCRIENADVGVRVYAAKGISDIATFNNSVFSNCGVGILVSGKGADIRKCTFWGNGKGTAIELNAVQNNCLINYVEAYGCDRGIDAIGSGSNLITIRNSNIHNNSSAGVIAMRAKILPSCSIIKNNYKLGTTRVGSNIIQSYASSLAMEPALFPGSGNSDLSSTNSLAVSLNGSFGTFIDKANSNFLTNSDLSISGKLIPLFIPKPNAQPVPLVASIIARNNYWKNSGSPSPTSGVDYSIAYNYGGGPTYGLWLDDKGVSLSSSPVYTGCPIPEVTADPQPGTANYSSLFTNKPTLILSNGMNARTTFSMACDAMNANTPNYVTAFNLFKNIISSNYSHAFTLTDAYGAPISAYGLWYDVIDLSHSRMLECISQGMATGQITASQAPSYVNILVAGQDNIMNLMGTDTRNAPIKFQYYLDRALLARLIGNRALAISTLNSLNSWSYISTDLRNLQQYYTCVIDKETQMLNGTLTKAEYVTQDQCLALLRLPDYGDPNQTYPPPTDPIPEEVYGKNGSDNIDENLSTTEQVTEINNQSLLDNINIYPNPSKDVIYITMPLLNTVTKIDIVDITGRVVLSPKINHAGDVLTLPVDVENGTYFIEITTPTTISRKKIVIVK